MLVCETEYVGLLIGNSFNSRRDEWVAQVKLANHCAHKYNLSKIVMGASFHLNKFEENKKAWKMDYSKKADVYKFDPGYVDEEYPEFDEETFVFMKAMLGEGVTHKEDRLIKHVHRLCFEKGGYWKPFEIAFQREWLEKAGALSNGIKTI